MKRLPVILTLISVFSFRIHAYTICLDPGHGGSDSGAVGTYYLEKNANLDVANALWDSLWYNLIEVTEIRMTRTSDVDRSLEDRVAIANGTYWSPPQDPVDRFISIHHNAHDGTVQGTETYCHPDASSYAFDLRNKVQSRLVEAFQYPDRGTKTADFYVLRKTTMPAILGEAFQGMEQLDPGQP